MDPLSIPTLSIFDGFLVALTLVSVLTAFRHGLVKVAFSFGGLVAGVLAAGWMQTSINEWLQPYLTLGTATEIMVYLATLILVYLAFAMFGEVALRVATGAGTGLGDRLLGAGFGLMRGGLIGTVALVMLTVAIPSSTMTRDSVFAPYLLSGTHAASSVLPEFFREQLGFQASPQIPAALDTLEARTLDNR